MQYSLTAKQAALLAFIKQYMRESGGVPPSFAEMCEGVGLASKSGVHRLLHGLKERGHIDMMQNRARSLVLLEAGK